MANCIRFIGTRTASCFGRVKCNFNKVDDLSVAHYGQIVLSPVKFSEKSKQFLRVNCICLNDCGTRKWLTTTMSMMERLKPEQVRKRVEDLTDRFAEARELLGDARESLGSTYFSDDMIEAQEAVSSTITAYQSLLKELEADQQNDVIRTIGLRMEELKAQEQAIKDLLD